VYSDRYHRSAAAHCTTGSHCFFVFTHADDDYIMVCGILQYDATLVEFNHVMLNHLYALSIKVTASLEFFTCIGQMMKELAFDDDDDPSNETK